MPRQRVLAADVGGTHTRLSLHEIDAREPEGASAAPRAEARLRSGDHPSLEALLRHFLDAHGSPPLDGACLAVAGPVIDGAVRLTNLGWDVERDTLAAALGAPRLRLVNDLEATAFGMLHLPPGRFEALQRGTRPRAGGSVVVAAAGTGFGLAVLDWDGAEHHPRATESGHVSFAPRNEREIAVLRGLIRRHGRVSLEHVVSGPGLAAVHDVLCEVEGVAPAETVSRAEDRSAAIAEAGVSGSEPTCAAALAVFCESYAAAAGDAALAHLALGGVWLGGGIAPKLLPALRRPAFLEAFADKGRFRPLLESLPLEVCLEPDTALHGAARLALRDADADAE